MSVFHFRDWTFLAKPRKTSPGSAPFFRGVNRPRRCSSGVEQRIRNAWVGGSNPLNGTRFRSLREPHLAQPTIWATPGEAFKESVDGPVAQLGERVVRNDEVVGSIPIRSTTQKPLSYSLLRPSGRGPDWAHSFLMHYDN
jgi:hypothetical protein